MNRSSRPKALFRAQLILLAFAASACTDSSAPQLDGPPPLPLLKSMQADVAFFNPEHPGAQSTNYTAARALMLAQTAATIASMPFSTAMFDGADAVQPDQQSDGFHWTYPVVDAANVLDADLKGRARGVTDIVWEMRVTSGSTTPALTDFLVFSGTSNLIFRNQEWTTEEGQWKVFDHTAPSTQTALLDVFWFLTGADSWRLVFINTKTGSPNLGDQFEFQSTIDLRRVEYLDQSAGPPRSVIEWNTTTNAGSIASATFNGGAKACWNAQFLNAACQN